MYWAASTMTTVGYGDVTPKTTAGRIIAVVVMMVGIGFVAVVTGAVADRDSSPRRRLSPRATSPSHKPRAITHAKLDVLAERLDRLEAFMSKSD